MYETVMGSVCYGVSTDVSDFDTLGFCVPPKDMLFPHLAGVIPGFGRQPKRFEVYQQHHVFDKDALNGAGRSYDLNVYSITKYFQLCMENNPNMVDSLFTPQECVLHSTKIGNMVRDQRNLFLHKGSWHKFKGYAYNQLHKMDSKDPQPDSKRAALREQFGFDVKFAYHVIRLLDEAEQILPHGDIVGRVRDGKFSVLFVERRVVIGEDVRDSHGRYAPDLAGLNLERCILHPATSDHRTRR
jgi:predicted nucleotidyltransferase